MLPPVTEHVPLHSKSLCKNMAREFGGGGGGYMHPLSFGRGAQISLLNKGVITSFEEADESRRKFNEDDKKLRILEIGSTSRF